MLRYAILFKQLCRQLFNRRKNNIDTISVYKRKWKRPIHCWPYIQPTHLFWPNPGHSMLSLFPSPGPWGLVRSSFHPSIWDISCWGCCHSPFCRSYSSAFCVINFVVELCKTLQGIGSRLSFFYVYTFICF